MSALNDQLLKTLCERFSTRSPRLADRTDNLLVTFPAEIDAVGDVQIFDDGTEFTLLICNITHIHFEHDTDPEFGTDVIANLVDCLDELFDDKILMWTGPGGMGGTRHVNHQSGRVRAKGRYFWSRPAH